ncbi:MAG: hypothetical protein Q3974_05755 [Rothia sp. (in: high G+C Gram-positive bacteria)]|nr:hypothetical protein [Rothia sp. (in: high G+C Gram-positive bacteria)]
MAHNQQDDGEKRSNVESLGMQQGSDNPRGPQHSGEGRLGGNLVIFIISMAIFVFGLWLLGMYPGGGPIWWIVSIVVMVLPWGLCFHAFSSKTNSAKRVSSTELTQL